MEGRIDEGTEEVDDGSDKRGLVEGVLRLPLVGPREGDVERDRLVVGEWGERRGEGTHVDDLYASELRKLPGLADGKGAVGVEL